MIQRIAKELRLLAKAPPEGIQYLPTDDENLSEIHVEIKGPGTCIEPDQRVSEA